MTRQAQTVLYAKRLTTAEILYHMPDHPALLQRFIWQHMDVAPEYPRLQKFLDYWQENIEGRLHSVTIANARRGQQVSVSYAAGEFRLH